MTQLPHSLTTTVRAIRPETIELVTEDGQILTWPSKKLAEVQIGDIIELVALGKNDVESERAHLAKHVLNYMLSGDEGIL